MSSEIGALTAKLTADNSQFDETQKKSEEVAASGKMREKAAKLAAEAEAFAARFVGDTSPFSRDELLMRASWRAQRRPTCERRRR